MEVVNFHTIELLSLVNSVSLIMSWNLILRFFIFVMKLKRYIDIVSLLDTIVFGI
ncbi:hypothetical protein JHK82_039328 [Glycine max]|uniref:Uncharacterized protein n=2 Tax=Glycine subgen. Soja TaxID=1462606 RepID=K7M5X8_SOYBN|nr:hypothetical protein JHK87_039302 [Glycine soja]KAG4962637.1 hypothetical protein JHK86_039505 [Glycine max]KAG4965109.1 hypothetical protein JHK85_040084 [Glycine max]KAG5110105.1 hypothetical protein JHK82_039328 [Glycine max]KAG5121390.1 hypothetical protein JHK84_039730 [Glycine max]